MNEREGAPEAAELRSGLHALVDDVEPRGDALAKLLAARRRHTRKAPRRPLFAVGGAAVAATAVFLVALVALPGAPRRPEPVSVAPNSYVAASADGELASYDVLSGRQVRPLAQLGAPVRGAPAADGVRIFARIPAGGGEDVVGVSADGTRWRVAHATRPGSVLAAGGGRVAHVDADQVVVSGSGAEQRIPVPAGQRVTDLALGGDGRLAVLTSSGADSQLGVVPPGATTMRPLALPAGTCGPLAVTWSGGKIAALSPAACDGSSGRVRITTVDENGEMIGAGAPVDLGALPGPERLQLSTDPLGRFLISVTGGGQWLVDGSAVRPVPRACAPSGECAAEPGTFWG